MNSVKNAITSAPRRIYSGASNALNKAREKVGAFHARTVQPRLDSLKAGLDEARSSLKSKYEQFRHSKTEPNSKPFKQEFAELEAKLKDQDDHSGLTKDIILLAGKAKNMQDFAELILLLDYSLSDGKPRDLTDFRGVFVKLPFLKDDIDGIRENLSRALSQKNHSYENLNPQLHKLLDEKLLKESVVQEILKDLSELKDIKDLPNFIMQHKDAFPPGFDPYYLQSALDTNKSRSQASINDLKSIREELLKKANAQGLNEAIKDTVDQSLMGAIKKSMQDTFGNPLPVNLKAHIETMNIKELSPDSRLSAIEKWIGSEYTNPDTKKNPSLASQLIVMGKLDELQLGSFQISQFKKLGLDIPKEIKDNLLEQLGHIETHMKVLKDVAQTKGIGETAFVASADPLIPLASALFEDIQVLKEESARSLDCSLESLVSQAKNQLNIKQKASYTEDLKRLFKKHITSKTPQALLNFFDENNEDGIKKELTKIFNDKDNEVLRNPFSEQGLSPISFGQQPGEFDLKLIKEDPQAPELDFIVHLGLDNNQVPKTASVRIPLKLNISELNIKEQKDLASIKASVIKNRESKAKEQLKELALLQVAADNKKDIDSDYDLETLKNTLINKEMQTILDAKLNEKAEKAREPGLQFENAPQGPKPKEVLPEDNSPKSILKQPKNKAGADNRIYQNALKAATAKVEADIKAYIEANKDSLIREYVRREPNRR